MPYSSISELPKGTSKLPKHAKEIYLAAFNSAHEQYDEEATAHATAWAAVKRDYKKNDDGKWVKKASQIAATVPFSDSVFKVVSSYLKK